MRAQIVAGLLAAVAVVTGCGDDGKQMTEPDAAPDSPTGPQCNDGLDNDGDGLKDYPSDPGCVAPQQDDELDDCPSGPNCPQCGNKVDDDGNGSIDYPNDPGCTSAADPFEFANNPVACGAGLTIKQLPSNGLDSGMLATSSSTSMLTSPCGGGGGAPAFAYQISLTDPKVVVANTVGSTADTVLDLRPSNCTQASLGCNDDISASITASSLTKSLPAGNYYLIVSGADSATSGDYSLEVKLYTGEGETCTSTQQCGPGLVCRTPLGGTGMKCSKPQCSDTVDDDGDGKNDYPTDPGCTGPDDNDEADTCPTGPGCPACSNGLDDDNDTRTDYPADTSCTAASGNSEACSGEQDPLNPITAGTTPGTLVGAHDDHNPTCGSDGGGDILYTLTVPPMRSLVIDTEGTVADTLLSLMTSACTEPGLGCDDDGGTSGSSSRLLFTNLAGGQYIVAVDMYNATKPPAPYDLHVTGVIQPGGLCGPIESLGGALTCPASNPCGPGPGGPMICLPSACGDGMDNDGDGKTDFPMDPGCTAIDDTSEADSCPGAGPNCPECADGVDNDGDGQTDYPADASCSAPSSASEGCLSTDGVVALTMPVTTGTTVGLVDDVHPPGVSGCASSTNTAPDRTFSLQLPALKNLSITGDNLFDGTLVLYNSTCGGTPLACSDPEVIARTNVAAGNYFLVFDGYSTGSGAFTLKVNGTIQNGASCESPLAQSGALVCGTGFSCAGTVGSRTCRPAACGDGIDNDGDGVADYPNDPGCASVSDSDESDNCPGGAGCPACSDGVDNDGDLLIDYPDDPSCASASSNTETCNTSENVAPLVMPMTSDTTAGATNDDTPSCGASSTAPDRIYSFTVPALTSLSIRTTGTGFTPATSVYGASCGAPSLACTTTQPLTMTAVAAGSYYFSVDGTSTAAGPYTITVSGNIATGGSCEGVLAVSGALTCGPGLACKGTMGSRTCQPTQCADGMDNDADGAIDYPNEPGCTSASDDDETNPTTLAACSNMMDDDGDSLQDYPADYGCSSAAADSEVFCAAEVDMTAAITSTPIAGTTAGMTNNFPSNSCQSTSTGPDVAFGLQLPVPVTTLVLDLSTSAYDTVLSLRDTQCTTQLGCDDDSGDPSNQSKLTVNNLAAGSYAVVVDGYNSASGAFTLAVRGTVAAGTSCTSPLFAAGVLACPMGTTCTGTPATCQ